MSILLGLPLKIFSLLGHALLVLVRFLPLVLLLVLGVYLYRKHQKVSRETDPGPDGGGDRNPDFSGPVVTVDYKEVTEEELSAEPERPASFAHKPGWLAIRSRDPKAVLDTLDIRDRKAVNWTAGLAGVTANRWFVSPSLDGWVILVAEGDREIPAERFRSLSRQFGEVQGFVSDRERSTYAWSRYCAGEVVRAYGIAGGRVFLDEGDWTAEEIALGFGRFPRKTGGPREGFPDGDAVLAIAAAWAWTPCWRGRAIHPAWGGSARYGKKGAAPAAAGGGLAACGGWSMFRPPAFCATESTPPSGVKERQGCRPGPAGAHSTRVPRPEEIRNRLASSYRCRSIGGNVGDLMFYRFLSVEYPRRARLPLPGELAPVRRLVSEGSRMECR